MGCLPFSDVFACCMKVTHVASVYKNPALGKKLNVLSKRLCPGCSLLQDACKTK